MMLSSAFDASSEGKELRSIWLRTAKDDCRSPIDVSFGSSISFSLHTWAHYLVLSRSHCRLCHLYHFFVMVLRRFATSCVIWRPAPHLIHEEFTKNCINGICPASEERCRRTLKSYLSINTTLVSYTRNILGLYFSSCNGYIFLPCGST